MTIPFYKYQGTGNDFIIINQHLIKYMNPDDTEIVQRLCSRKFGIGADGLMFLEKSETEDFRMVYFNADGRQSSMCGNGGRCIVHLAKDLGLCGTTCTFEAVDGIHSAILKSESTVRLKMNDVNEIVNIGDAYELDTGSPHYVEYKDVWNDNNFVIDAREIRYSQQYHHHGINVNCYSVRDGVLFLRTYERGVEDETYSCGTGVTAASLVEAFRSKLEDGVHSKTIETKGGQLEVEFELSKGQFSNIWLSGPVQLVYEGSFAY